MDELSITGAVAHLPDGTEAKIFYLDEFPAERAEALKMLANSGAAFDIGEPGQFGPHFKGTGLRNRLFS